LYSALRENTANALNETHFHSNRCVFKSRRNWSGPTAGTKFCRSDLRNNCESAYDYVFHRTCVMPMPGRMFQISYIFCDKQNTQTVKTTNAEIYW